MTERSTSNPNDIELLSAYIDGELSDSEIEILEKRLESELALQEEWLSLRQTVQLIQQLPQLKAPRDFRLSPELLGLSPTEKIITLPKSKPGVNPYVALFSALAAMFIFVIALPLLTAPQNGATASQTFDIAVLPTQSEISPSDLLQQLPGITTESDLVEADAAFSQEVERIAQTETAPVTSALYQSTLADGVLEAENASDTEMSNGATGGAASSESPSAKMTIPTTDEQEIMMEEAVFEEEAPGNNAGAAPESFVFSTSTALATAAYAPLPTQALQDQIAPPTTMMEDTEAPAETTNLAQVVVLLSFGLALLVAIILYLKRK